jgi:alpha-glucuronidase
VHLLNNLKQIAFTFLLSVSLLQGQVPEGYDLWLGYRGIENNQVRQTYTQMTRSIYFVADNEILENAHNELVKGLSAMLGTTSFDITTLSNASNSMVIAKKSNLTTDLLTQIEIDYDQLGKEGFLIATVHTDGKETLVLSANEDVGILYGVFRLLQFMQAQKDIIGLDVVDAPKIQLRMLDHWDNLDRTVERGYAGFSIWNWQKLPEFIDQRYIDYARANASIGINGTVLTNVNANAWVLTPMYLDKVEALANLFRAYGIKVYLTARFSAPIELGGLPTADPLNEEVQRWWNEKAKEIYKRIPDFGGFLVKANSEGQPGPQNYGRTHVDGANMLATSLEPFGGNVIWRAFVYSEHDATDRAKQAFEEFVPFDGKFKENVLVQVKNGPIDFQPREPFHPMFGAMPKTPLMMEFQITQEYLGFSTHLVFLPTLFEEVLHADTFTKGKGSLVARVIDGSLDDHTLSGMAGVANIGTDLNWTGHPFAQANWYGFGRLAWDPYLSSETIAEEWLRATYSNVSAFLDPMKKVLMGSREAVVNYMDPLGLHHIFDTGHHYGPGPWVDNLNRPDWNPVYYHKADVNGIGFDRTPTGSNATAQYAREVADSFNHLKTCPEEYLLWFHHLSWDYKLRNGHTLWDGMALKYQHGVDAVKEMIAGWDQMIPYVSESRHKEVKMLLNIQLKEAKWWRNACLLYFQTFSKKELPLGVEPADHSLEYYKSLKFPYAPGIKPRW